MSQTKSLPSSTTAPIEASTISRRLSVFDPQMQRMELFKRAKLRGWNSFRAESFDASCFGTFEGDGPAPSVNAKTNGQNVALSTSVILVHICSS